MPMRYMGIGKLYTGTFLIIGKGSPTFKVAGSLDNGALGIQGCDDDFSQAGVIVMKSYWMNFAVTELVDSNIRFTDYAFGWATVSKQVDQFVS